MNNEFKKKSVVLSCLKENLHFFYIYKIFMIEIENMYFIYSDNYNFYASQKR
jgi:hypothetical protein